MKEIISPNVTHIVNLEIPVDDLDINSATLHPSSGVIEINLDGEKCADVLKAVEEAFDYYEAAGHLYPVSVTGRVGTPESENTGSVRFCDWEYEFAESLTEIIDSCSILELINDDSDLWQFEAVSKYFRFMRYEKGGQHFPHYDSDFTVMKAPSSLGAKPLYSTKYSLVMYFNDCETGEIAFIDKDVPGRRVDWARQAYDEEIFLKIKPQACKIVLFPHTLCHTVLPFTDDGYRYIVRGDLIFSRVM